jgi:hypothetical protein
MARYLIKTPTKCDPVTADNWRSVTAMEKLLADLNGSVTGTSSETGKLLVAKTDLVSDYLKNKLIAGTGITLTKSNTGGQGSEILTAAIGAHADLTDMPDTAGDNTDHDERYRVKQQDAQPTTHADFWLDTNATFGTPFIIGDGEAGVDFELKFDGETNDGSLVWMEDEDYFQLNDDLIFYGSGVGFPYGEIYIDNGTETLTLTTSFAKVVNFDTEGANGIYNLMTPDKANNKLTITIAGTYRVHAKFSGKSTKVSAVYLAVFIDGVEQNNIESEVNTVENGQLCVVAEGLVTIAANKDIDIRLKYSGAEAAVVTCAHVNLHAVMVGG